MFIFAEPNNAWSITQSEQLSKSLSFNLNTSDEIIILTELIPN
ncbi:hypothetical protein MCHI_002032 [Candidatus Magnetoovum chiemensis]|nr:hypothetical protein MCHI_002032 [Candidatus Magnetoovum chiemensis]